MTRRRRLLIAPASFASIAIVSLALWGSDAALATPTVASGAVAAAATDLSGKNYVALGDPYSAGYGLTPYSDSPAAGCYQADENYPHLIAAELGLNLTDVTCSGAVTADIIDTYQTTMTGQGVAKPQSLALSDQTDIVTVTIGGNDLGFADVAQSCFAFGPKGPTLTGFDTCTERYDPAGVDTLAYKIDTVVAPALDKTFSWIKAKAPNAKVFVIGYPTIAPDAVNTPAGGCFTNAFGQSGVPPYPANTFPYTATDTAYLHSVEAKLDAAIHDKAVANGATYINTLPLTEAHSACAPAGDAFVNGVSLILSGTGEGTPLPPTPTVSGSASAAGQTDAAGSPASTAGDPASPAATAVDLPSTSGISVKLGALHPNAAGVAFLDAQVTAAIQQAFTALPGDPEATPTPTATAGGGAATPAPTSSAVAAGSHSATLASTGQVDLIPLGFIAIILLLIGAGVIVFIARLRTPAPKSRD